MAVYNVITEDGRWINSVEWDGVSPWTPPEGCVAIPFDDGVWTWDGYWTYNGVDYYQEFPRFNNDASDIAGTQNQE